MPNSARPDERPSLKRRSPAWRSSPLTVVGLRSDVVCASQAPGLSEVLEMLRSQTSAIVHSVSEHLKTVCEGQSNFVYMNRPRVVGIGQLYLREAADVRDTFREKVGCPLATEARFKSPEDQPQAWRSTANGSTQARHPS